MLKENKIVLFFLIITLITLSGCSARHDNDTIVLGDETQEQVWVYLCGLTNDFYSEEQLQERLLLHRIGLDAHIKIIAIEPISHCVQFNNALCWPHDDIVIVEKTYKQILSAAQGQKIVGFIGFSNGGFFLNTLVQIKKLGVPIISIGSAGFLQQIPQKNNLYVIIGKQDVHHYDLARGYVEKLEKYPQLQVHFIEHDGGHEVPEDILADVLKHIKVK